MSEGDPSPGGDPSGGDGSSGSKFNTHNPAVKRILREQREMLASDEDENESWCVHAEMCEDDIFEWHFAIMGVPCLVGYNHCPYLHSGKQGR